MEFVCKLFSINGIPASDGSVVPESTLLEFLSSPAYEEGIQNHSLLGTITHRFRTAENIPNNLKSNNLHKCVGKDDGMIMPDVASPTHYIQQLFIKDGWCWAKCKVLDLEGADEVATSYIKRLRWMLKNGIGIGVSMVCVGLWGGQSGTGTDVCRKILSIKGIDVTANASWKDAKIVSATDDEGEKLFSDNSIAFEEKFEGVKVKAFSNISEVLPGAPKTSKVNGQFCILKGKVFSNFSEVESSEKEEQKEFSVASIKERVRYAQFNPRMRFRRLIMEYKQAVKTLGGDKMKPETEKALKSLFATDVLDIMKSITPEITKGKPLGTLLGTSALGPEIREASQKLTIPLKMAFQQLSKTGYITKNYFEKVQTLYTQFITDLTNIVFNSNNSIPDLKEEDESNEEKEEKK